MQMKTLKTPMKVYISNIKHEEEILLADIINITCRKNALSLNYYTG